MRYIGIILMIGLLMISLFGCATPQQGKQLSQHADDHIASLPKEDISTDEVEALNLAINDEYKAKATYQNVIDKFGGVRPFSSIINSEENHINELKALFNKYDLDIPEDDWYEKVPEFSSITEACEGGVQAEIDNANLYDELFSMVDNQDITEVFTSLRDASRNNHLPAFERCGGMS